MDYITCYCFYVFNVIVIEFFLYIQILVLCIYQAVIRIGTKLSYESVDRNAMEMQTGIME